MIAPKSIDITHGNYITIDGVLHAYLVIPSYGYKPQVQAGWLSILVNAGEGIDLDIFVSRQPKEQIQRKLGQQLRINRSINRFVGGSARSFNQQTNVQSDISVKEYAQIE